MNIFEAKMMMDSLKKCGDALDEALMVAGKIEDEKSRETIEKGIMNVIGMLFTDATYPIIQWHPELNPHKK